MGKRLGIIGNYLAHYKYLIVIVIGGLYVCVLDQNSLLQHLRYQMQIEGLRSEIERYNQQYEHDAGQLKDMRHGTKVYQQIARERYFMKADNEDIFVLSTDLEEQAQKQAKEENETTE